MRKINSSLFFLIITLYIFCIIAVLMPTFTLLKDFVLIIVLAYTFLKDDTFYSKISALLFIYCFLMVIFPLFTGGLSLYDIINSRFLFLYPLLIQTGRLAYKQNLNINKFINIMNFYFIFIAIGAIYEFLFPNSFELAATLINNQYNKDTLYRTGLGHGLGSWYATRQILGIDLCVGIITINYSNNIKKYIKNFITYVYIILITLTLNRAAMLTTYIIFIILILKSLKFKITKKQLLNNILLIFSSIMIFGLLLNFFGDTFINSFENSLNQMDLTLSGRTDMWYQLFENKLKLYPQMDAFVKFANNTEDTLRTADNIYIRLWISYGFFSIIFILAFLIQIIKEAIKSKNTFFCLWIAYFLISGIALDTFSFVTTTVPFWIMLGYYLQKYKKREAVEHE